MMNCEQGNSLVVIESGQLTTYCLDDKIMWRVGRPAKENVPDILLRSAVVSRSHGYFRNMYGIWFYVDEGSKNGTCHNGRRVTPGIGGRTKPVILEDGDILVFGGSTESPAGSRTVWTMYLKKLLKDRWRVEDTRDSERITFSASGQSVTFAKPVKGTVFRKEEGIAVYMGDITYLIGDIDVIIE